MHCAAYCRKGMETAIMKTMVSESNRTDATQLPEAKELELILEREAKRPVAEGKENKHFATFELPIQWLEMLGIPTHGFTEDVSWQEIVARNTDIPAAVVERTMAAIQTGNSKLEELLQQGVTGYLGEEDKPEPSDEIYVFGSKSLKRIETAVDLYNQGIAPRIFITGGMPIYEKREEAEAQIYKRWAIEHGVPPEAIHTHDAAISVADNVRGGLNELDKLNLPYGSMALVTAWFAMRRSYAHMMKYVPEETRLYRVNAPVTPGGDYDQASWWKNPNGIKVVFNEFAKLRISEALNSS